MKFTTMQQAVAMGALTAVAASPSQADNGFSGSAELVLYVVNVASGSTAAYSRGLSRIDGQTTGLTFSGTAIAGPLTTSGFTTTYTSLTASDTAALVAIQAAANTQGFTNGYNSQPQISVNYSLPTIAPDANLVKWLAANSGGDIRWSIQAGHSTGNGSGAGRRWFTTSPGGPNTYDLGVNVTNTNLGMAVSEVNVWIDINSVINGDNLLNASTSNGDGTSITNSTYLSYTGDNNSKARYWFSTSTNPSTAVDALVPMGQAGNFYEFVSNNVNTTGGGKVWVITFNDLVLDSAGYLRSLQHK